MTRTTLALAFVLLAALCPRTLAAQATETGPDTVTFNAKRGTVVFTHNAHAKQMECVTCHHDSRPEKQLESKYQKCTACHTNPASAPVTTTLRNAMHDTASREGLCLTCHTREAAAGKTIPVKCNECHKQGG